MISSKSGGTKVEGFEGLKSDLEETASVFASPEFGEIRKFFSARELAPICSNPSPSGNLTSLVELLLLESQTGRLLSYCAALGNRPDVRPCERGLG